MGSHPLPADVTEGPVLEHFGICCQNILTLIDDQVYTEAKLEGWDAWEIGPAGRQLRFLHAKFSFGIPDSPVTIDVGRQASHLLLTTFDGYFLKIRISQPIGRRAERMAEIPDFLTDLLVQLMEARERR